MYCKEAGKALFMAIFIFPLDILSTTEAFRINEEVALGLKTSDLWQNMPQLLKWEPKCVVPSQQKDMVLQDPLSLSARILSQKIRCHADSAPAPTYSLSPCYFCLSSNLFINNVFYSRWCRQAAARLGATKGDPSHLASPVPEDAGSARAHAQRCGVSS